MIADNVTTETKRPLMVALEDTIVVGAFAFFSGLIATGAHYPPTIDLIWATALSASLAGVVSWAKARNIAVG